jgi:ABC-type bacteriocin/lantibiotic exporter with double-glycine peptidase domain
MENIDWRKHHCFIPHEGWCGPATIKMVLSACGIKKSLRSIARDVYVPWYGTPSALLIAYLSKYFSLVNYRTGATISDISRHLTMGHILIVNFWDNGDGHYAIISEYKDGYLTIVDSSRERGWTWALSAKELKNIWYDTITETLWHEGLLIWISPSSKRVNR